MITAKEARKQALIKSYELLTNEQKDVINNWMEAIKESVNGGGVGNLFHYNLPKLYNDDEFQGTVLKYMVLSGYNVNLNHKDKIVKITWIDNVMPATSYTLKTK